MSKEDAEFLFNTVSDEESAHPRLVMDWFKLKQDACKEALARATNLAFRGADDSQTPGSLVEQIDTLRVQIKFNFLLAERALTLQRPTWTGLKAEAVATAAKSHIDEMGGVVTKIDELHAFILKINDECRK